MTIAADGVAEIAAEIARSLRTASEPDPEWLAHVDDDAPRSAATESPTHAEPLRGLAHLARVATLGRACLMDLACVQTHYVWQDIAVSGTIVLLASGPSEGKTTLLFLLLVARATLGAPVALLGRGVEPASRGKYLVVIEGEHSESSAARKLLRS